MNIFSKFLFIATFLLSFNVWAMDTSQKLYKPVNGGVFIFNDGHEWLLLKKLTKKQYLNLGPLIVGLIKNVNGEMVQIHNGVWVEGSTIDKDTINLNLTPCFEAYNKKIRDLEDEVAELKKELIEAKHSQS